MTVGAATQRLKVRSGFLRRAGSRRLAGGLSPMAWAASVDIGRQDTVNQCRQVSDVPLNLSLSCWRKTVFCVPTAAVQCRAVTGPARRDFIIFRPRFEVRSGLKGR